MAKQDLSSFQLREWSLAADRIHQRMALVIPKPELPVIGALMAK
jgi:hypothetical protein